MSYYSALQTSYITPGETSPKAIFLAAEDDLELINGVLTVRLRFTKGLKWRFTDHEDCQQCNDVLQDQSDYEPSLNNEDCSRGSKEEEREEKQFGRERTIGYVVEKVTQWRRLYNGFYDENFYHHRMSLEAAAQRVGISKKSLDDYLAQLRAGRQFGYDFN